MAYVISELGHEMGRADSLASLLRKLANIVAKNECDGESNYIFVRDSEGREVLHIHEEGRNSREHTAKVLAQSQTCTMCDGDGFDGRYVESCPRCGGSGREAVVKS